MATGDNATDNGSRSRQNCGGMAHLLVPPLLYGCNSLCSNPDFLPLATLKAPAHWLVWLRLQERPPGDCFHGIGSHCYFSKGVLPFYCGHPQARKQLSLSNSLSRGLLRVKGRLNNADPDQINSHHIILDRKSPLVKLLLLQLHLKSNQGGPTTMSALVAEAQV